MTKTEQVQLMTEKMAKFVAIVGKKLPDDVEAKLAELRAKGYDVVTHVTQATTFWPAEGYHQDYYDRKGTQPYCHAYTKRF